MRVFNKIQREKYGRPRQVKIAKKILENSTDPKTDVGEFQDWYLDFMSREYGYRPQDIKTWFNTVEENHAEIRRLLGGVKKHHIVRLAESSAPANTSACQPYIDTIKRYLPMYMPTYRMTDKDLLYGTLSSGIKTSKHITQYINRMRGTLSEDTQKLVLKAVAKLGEEWARAKTSEEELTVTITTSPKAFALIGHYGPDSSSCFRQGNTNAQNKYNLAVLPNTFVVLFREGNIIIDEPKESKNVKARMWGFYNHIDQVMNFCNFYKQGHFPDGNAIAALKDLCGCLFDVPPHDVKCTDQIIKVDIESRVFHNANANQNWSLYTGKDHVDQQVLAPLRGEAAAMFYVQHHNEPRNYAFLNW